MTETPSLDGDDGLGQAFEDAAALAAVLPAGTNPGDVPERLKLFEEIRAERAYRLQAYARRSIETSGGLSAVEGKRSGNMRDFQPRLTCTPSHRLHQL